MHKSTIVSGVGGLLLAATIASAQQRPATAKPLAPGASRPAPTAPSTTGVAAPKPATAPVRPEAKASTDTSADEAAIRRAADAFVKAYDAKDAAALVALFTPNGVIFDSRGAAQQGRDAIKIVFDGVFQDHPQAKMQISIDSILFASPQTAIEEGTTAVTHAPGEAPERMRYTVTHAKQPDGKWLMASARDLEDVEALAATELTQLDWLVGDWVDESAGGLVKTSYAWNENHTFLIGQFALHISGQPAMSGSQRIGWDPLAKQVRSWIFDSEGGFGEGLWSRDHNRWIVKLTGVTRDGRIGSVTQIFTRESDHKYQFESRDRLVGAETAPNVGPVSVVRSPPGPIAKAKTSK